mgnify:CR=1 FL=1
MSSTRVGKPTITVFRLAALFTLLAVVRASAWPLAAWLLALMWILPLAYAVWTAFHPPAYSTRFELLAPLTLNNFARAWEAAPFAQYFLNTILLVAMILASQLVLSTLAAYAFARYHFRGKNVLFALVLVQLMIMPDILLVACLLHDIGKLPGAGARHPAIGAPIAREITAVLGFDEADVALVERLVREHLTLAELATKRDHRDPATVDALRAPRRSAIRRPGSA